MSLKITANTLFTKRFLKVDSGGVTFYGGTGLSSARRFRFDQIVCVLMSPDNQLSIQVNNEVFSIPPRPDKPAHQAVIAALLQETRLATVPGN